MLVSGAKYRALVRWLVFISLATVVVDVLTTWMAFDAGHGEATIWLAWIMATFGIGWALVALASLRVALTVGCAVMTRSQNPAFALAGIGWLCGVCAIGVSGAFHNLAVM